MGGFPAIELQLRSDYQSSTTSSEAHGEGWDIAVPRCSGFGRDLQAGRAGSGREVPTAGGTVAARTTRTAAPSSGLHWRPENRTMPRRPGLMPRPTPPAGSPPTGCCCHPVGSGILVVGTDQTTVRNNTGHRNGFVGIAVADTDLLAQLVGGPIEMEPFPDGARVENNTVTPKRWHPADTLPSAGNRSPLGWYWCRGPVDREYLPDQRKSRPLGRKPQLRRWSAQRVNQ